MPARNPSDTLTVVLFDKVDLSHAPWGRNREERFIFSHLYETLLTIDCNGEFQSGLAKTVVEASDGWLVTLRDDAHFWDETSVTSQDVVESFKPAIAGGIAIKAVDPIDERQFLIRGYDARPDVKLLTLQMASITKPSPTAGPPIGTGSWTLDENVPVAEAIVIRPVLATAPVVRFVRSNVSDARDIMDGTADAMITDDPAAIEYARTKKNVSLVPLTWDRVYVLVSRTRADAMLKALEIDQGATPLHDLVPPVQNGLARDVVQVDARGGSRLIRDSETGSILRSANDAVGAPNPTPAVLYVRGDETSRSLAERIVGLAAMDTSSVEARRLAEAVPNLPPTIRAVGVDTREFDQSLARGDYIAYVLPLSWSVDYPIIMYQFAERAFWAVNDGVTLRGTIFPLVETRAHFIAISDRIGFADDHTGNVRLMMPGEEIRR